MIRRGLGRTAVLVGVAAMTLLATTVGVAGTANAATTATPTTTTQDTTSITQRVAAAMKAAAPAAVGAWRQVSETAEFTPTHNEGVATVNPPGGTPSQYYVGTLSVPVDLAANWGHIGDPDSSKGYIFNDFQYSGSNPTSKLFRVTTPSGTHYDYPHTLVANEEYNNSWVAVSPDSQWMVNGEWDTMNHFLVFPTPILNPSTPQTGGALNLATYLDLDHPVRDVQGCTFFSSTRLLCSADDPDTDLFPTSKQLLQIDLPHALDGTEMTGHVTALGQLPLSSICSGTYEVEGDDYDPATGDLRVLIIQPGACEVVTELYTFTLSS
ncbi:MAG TPA: hypothetical protein VHW44_21555 [Pseudonocardiaceae bacterium]|jgi:hypothetical protein|nr:hypothetical protein [Pseudonocardiaceae bacterium]